MNDPAESSRLAPAPASADNRVGEAAMNDYDESAENRPSKPFQFGMRDLLLATVIACVMAVTYAGLSSRGTDWPIYVVLSCTAPLVLVTVAGLLHLGFWAVGRLRRRRLRGVRSGGR